jgi:hypothetical protein
VCTGEEVSTTSSLVPSEPRRREEEFPPASADPAQSTAWWLGTGGALLVPSFLMSLTSQYASSRVHFWGMARGSALYGEAPTNAMLKGVSKVVGYHYRRSGLVAAESWELR